VSNVASATLREDEEKKFHLHVLLRFLCLNWWHEKSHP
jgi:hypothetical protein